MKKPFWLLAALLAGCAASAPQYYSLQQLSTDRTASVGKVSSAYAISVQPVLVPEQVARPQIVVSTSPGAEVVPLSAALWAGPLEAQIRNALSDELTQRLNVLDVGLSSTSEQLPVWRIYLDVQRFDSFYGRSVVQEVVWRTVPQGMPEGVKERLCSAKASLPVGTGMSALVEGHRTALAGIVEVMAQTVLPPPWATGGGAQPVTTPEGVAFKGCVG